MKRAEGPAHDVWRVAAQSERAAGAARPRLEPPAGGARESCFVVVHTPNLFAISDILVVTACFLLQIAYYD